VNIENDLIECPHDSGNYYFRNVCTEVFRNSAYRLWCRDCKHFDQLAQTKEMGRVDTLADIDIQGSSRKPTGETGK
jgi:hypothetical protein